MNTLLACQSHYSLLWGTASPIALLQRAGELGIQSLAITDHANLYALPLLVREAAHLPCRPLFGASLATSDRRTECILLIETPTGYANLCQCLTRWHQATGRETHGDIANSLHGPLGGLIALCDDESLCRTLSERLPPDSLFYRTGRTLKQLPAWVRELQLKSAFAPPVWMTTPDEVEIHTLLTTIEDKGAWGGSPGEPTSAPGPWLQTPNEYRRLYSTLQDSMAVSDRIAQRIHFRPDPSLLFPANPHGTGSAIGELQERAYRGAEGRYGELSESVIARLEYELALIEEKGFAEYFLVVEDIVSISPRTCGRGSGAASLVNYCLGVTNVDPLRYHLMFERFLNKGRMDPPDIDIDFAWDERDRVLDTVFTRYGDKSAAMVANHLTFQPRMAIRETARCFGMSEEEISAAIKQLPLAEHVDAVRPVAANPARMAETESDTWQEILRLAARLIDLPRCLSLHCGGVILVPGQLSRTVPVEIAPKGVPMIQWEKDGTEEMGLVKIDLLGNRSLAVIRDASRSVAREGHCRTADVVPRIPADDPATADLIARGDTMGVFYVESPAMRLLQSRAQTGDFEHLVIHSSIIRPAANGYIQEYLRRLHGQAWEPLHPRLRGVFDESYGIPVYQEDVCKLAMALAGFDTVEADQLRKCLGKRDAARRLAHYREKFFAGGQAYEVPLEVLEEAWRMVMSMTGYSFCKPHSASYAQVSFESAYLKAHHPAAFMAAVISNGGGFYSPQAYVSEAMRLGLRILGPCLSRSDWSYRAEDGALRVGLMAIKGIRQEMIEAALDERESNGPYRNLSDLQRRTRLGPDDLRRLTVVGALDTIAPTLNRPQILWILNHPVERQAQSQLFAEAPRIPTLPPYSRRQRQEAEYAALGFLLGAHPLVLHQDAINALRHPLIPSTEIPAHTGRRITLLGWPVTGKVVTTKHKAAMEFFSFEDFEGIYETVLFPAVYERDARHLSLARPVLVTGVVEEEWETHTVTVQRILPLPDPAEESAVISQGHQPPRRCSSPPSALPAAPSAQPVPSGNQTSYPR
ncbi:MAG: DNA polymerase III subunit alpha [Planctomycetota bacterium]|jgi:DNA polymerase-3 subunit alpha/error-prone DNA polymerase